MVATDGYRLDDRWVRDDGRVFMTGIQALARLPIEQLRADRRAGLTTAAFVSGYQGSPLSTYGEAAGRASARVPELPVFVRPAMNEEYAATAVMGSQLANSRPDPRYDGVVGIWYGKAPGVDRAADALRHASFAGTAQHGGAVAIVGDDPNAKSSSLPSSSAGLLASMHMPVLYPGDPAETLDLGRHAIHLSRATGLWTALKIVADVADATASVDLDPGRVSPVIPLVDGHPYRHEANGRIMTPMTIDTEREIIEVRYELARRYAADNRLNRTTVDPGADAWLGIIASGITYREVREALSRLGLDSDDAIAGVGIRLFKMSMPLPFDPATVRRFASGLEQLLVIEEKMPTIESLIKDALYADAVRPSVVGRTDEAGEFLVPGWGALDADRLVPILHRRLAGRIGDRLSAPPRERTFIPIAVDRKPFFCSGCPHNRSTEVPDGTMVGGGVGCHTMALLMDPERVGEVVSLTAMGCEGTQWIGMSEFVDTDHIVQNLGDGTFAHSGQLAIQALIAAGTDITFKLLLNGTVAMTGGQHAVGELGVYEILRLFEVWGVARVIVTTEDVDRFDSHRLPDAVEVWDRSRIIEAQEVLAEVPGVTVMVHDQACAAENRRGRKRGLVETPGERIVINQRICEGCGDCGQISNCLSVQPVETEFGRKTRIDQTTCNFDYSCVEGDCPSFMTVSADPPGRLAGWLGRRGRKRVPSAASAPAVVSPPEVPAPPSMAADAFNLRITGIGGTGVVTVAQILGTAAMLDGWTVRGLDQIGLSQKAGPVVSDVRLTRGDASHTNRLGDAQADLLLAFDQLVAASPAGLSACRPERTTVVGSTSATPTGSMITHLDEVMPGHGELAERIREQTSDDHHWSDARTVTSELFGDAATANTFVVGMAVQAGALPISAELIEQAIELNGVAVEANLRAFAWGRAAVARPSSLAEALSVAAPSPDTAVVRPAAELADRIRALGVDADTAVHLDLLAVELVAWGDMSTARDWLEVLERVGRVEDRVVGGSRRLTLAVADHLFKLTAYKDEYEVARLMVDDQALTEARELAGDDMTISYKLHPPLLRALGLDSKIRIGAWATPAIRALAARKGLRGTAADPFRFAKVRRVERELRPEYVAAIDQVLAGLTAERLDAAVALATLPDMVRGYEDIKLANVERYRRRLSDSLAAFS